MHGREACVVGACVVGGGVCGRVACMAGGEGHPWQEKRQLQRAVRILLECILVLILLSVSEFKTAFLVMMEIVSIF